MAGSRHATDRPRAAPVADFDDQMWPINCAILILAGFFVGIVLRVSDFDEPEFLFNGYTHLAFIGLAGVVLCVVAYRLQAAVRRRLQLCVLLSLLVHLSAAAYVYCNPLKLPVFADPGGIGGSTAESDDDLIAPDYHWIQAEEPDAQQTFDSPVETVVRAETPLPTTLRPRNVDRPVPVAEMPRPTTQEISPLGSGGAGRPVEMSRAAAAAPPQAAPIAAMAIERQAGRAVDIPKLDAETPLPVPEAPKPAAAKPLEPTATTAQTWPSTPKGGPEPTRPRAMTRVEPQPARTLTDVKPTVQLPVEVASRVASQAKAMPGSAALDRPSTLVRTDRGDENLPSGVLTEPTEPASPAAMGGSMPSRIEAAASVAVEASRLSKAPLGPDLSAAGTQEFGTGSSLIATRSGISDGRGVGRPSISGLTEGDAALLRRGSAGSFLRQGAPLPAAAARRGTASQTETGGSGLTPNMSATLPRTQLADGVELPSAAVPSEPVATAGAGGLASSPGGGGSRLEAGNRAVGRSLGPIMPDRRNQFGGAGDLGIGPTTGLSPVPTAVGDRGETVAPAGPAGDAAVTLGTAQGAGPSAGIARTMGSPDLPGGVADAGDGQPLGVAMRGGSRTGSQSGTSGGRGGDHPFDSTIGSGTGTFGLGGPDFGLGRDGPVGRRLGMSPVGNGDLADLGGMDGGRSPQPSGVVGHRTQEDEELVRLTTTGGPGRIAVTRAGAGPALEGAVKEPTEFYRRRAATRHGLGPGDSDGSGFTEPAVETGLDFFTRLQFPDGHWSLEKLPEGVRADGAALGEMQSDSAATGLVLLTYLGAGYTHLDEKHRDVVRRGIEWLMKHQKPDGDLFTGGSAATHFYSHGIAAMAVCEAYGMTQDPDLRDAAQRAVQFIIRTQDPRRGGWRYEPGEESDTSVTGWQLMALKSGQMAGLDVPEETFRKIGGWLDRAQGPGDDGRYVYNPWNLDNDEQREGRLPSPAMTAEAMLMRMYLGQRRDDPRLAQAAEYLKANLPEVGTREQSLRNCYYWYYATQAMYQMQGDYWTTWNGRIGPLIKAGQTTVGDWRGSWHPTEPVPDRWGPAAGRVYVTAMHLLMLEVYYRHLPLFQELSK